MPFDTPDPWCIFRNGRYYLTFTSGGDKIEVWSSLFMTDFFSCRKQVIWQPVDMCDIWAPELHVIDDQWFIYFCAAVPGKGNESHRLHVLAGPPSETDPQSDQWMYVGPIRGLPDNWAIDGTIFNLNNMENSFKQPMYLCYSGWPQLAKDDLVQELWIAKLLDPTTAASPRMIAQPDRSWECSDRHKIMEGPQYLSHGLFTGIIYSCAGSWTADYKMGILKYIGGRSGDPLRSASWNKIDQPLIQCHPERGPYGPGHGCFPLSPDGKERWAIYHATKNKTDGWSNRRARAQVLGWANGLPSIGHYPLDDMQICALPSGTTEANESGQSMATDLPEHVTQHHLGIRNKLKRWKDDL